MYEHSARFLANADRSVFTVVTQVSAFSSSCTICHFAFCSRLFCSLAIIVERDRPNCHHDCLKWYSRVQYGNCTSSFNISFWCTIIYMFNNVDLALHIFILTWLEHRIPNHHHWNFNDQKLAVITLLMYSLCAII